jgi:hypothetical protein
MKIIRSSENKYKFSELTFLKIVINMFVPFFFNGAIIATCVTAATSVFVFKGTFSGEKVLLR